MKKVTCISLLFFFCCLVVSPVLADQEAKTSDILAKVGDKTFTSEQFDAMAQTMPPQIQVMLKSNPSMKSELINRWIQLTLLVHEAEAMKLDQDPAVKTKLDDLRSRVLVDALIDKRITRTTSLPEEKIKAYYDSHASEFEKGEQVRARHILIRVEQNSAPEVDAKAKETIDMVAEKLKNGESFETLALEYSEDPGSKINGGDLGYFGKGQMVKEFEEAAFATKVNEVSEPVRTAFGYHLIMLTDKKAPGKVPFDDVKKQIETTLLAEQDRVALNNLIEELKKKYEVTIY